MSFPGNERRHAGDTIHIDPVAFQVLERINKLGFLLIYGSVKQLRPDPFRFAAEIYRNQLTGELQVIHPVKAVIRQLCGFSRFFRFFPQAGQDDSYQQRQHRQGREDPAKYLLSSGMLHIPFLFVHHGVISFHTVPGGRGTRPPFASCGRRGFFRVP